MTELEVLHSPFNAETHKKTFVNYLEVIILEDGTIEYAVPSHQQKLISICCSRLNVSANDLDAMCPPRYYCNYMDWLCMTSNAVAVWNDFVIGTCNDAQIEALRILKSHGLYRGKIHERTGERHEK